MMVRANNPLSPVIYAVDPWVPGTGRRESRQLLTERQRKRLMAMASLVRFRKGETIYRAGTPATQVFNLLNGVAAAHGDGRKHIIGFIHPGDLFGLSEAGIYANTVVATTAVTAWSLPVENVRRFLLEDSALDVGIVVKLCHDLREAQRHALLLSQKHAVTRLAMFLDLQEHIQTTRGERAFEIYLPMSRSIVADYVGLSLPAVSRAFASLAAQGVIEARDLRHVRIVNPAALRRLAAVEPPSNGKGKRKSNGEDRGDLPNDERRET